MHHRTEAIISATVPALIDLVSIVLFLGMVAVWAAIAGGAR